MRCWEAMGGPALHSRMLMSGVSLAVRSLQSNYHSVDLQSLISYDILCANICSAETLVMGVA